MFTFHNHSPCENYIFIIYLFCEIISLSHFLSLSLPVFELSFYFFQLTNNNNKRKTFLTNLFKPF